MWLKESSDQIQEKSRNLPASEALVRQSRRNIVDAAAFTTGNCAALHMRRSCAGHGVSRESWLPASSPEKVRDIEVPPGGDEGVPGTQEVIPLALLILL